MRVFVLFAFLLVAPAAAGQTTDSQALTPAGLRTHGLNFGDDLTKLYVGDFSHVGFARNSTELSMLVNQYMNVFSRSCVSELPENKVEIMTQECARESWTVNGYGVEQPGSRHCVSYRTVGTGRYADPEVYKLSNQLGATTARAMTGELLGGMKPGGDPTSGMRRMTDLATYAKNDMPKLFQANGCASPALKRLQANMIRFGQGSDPIVMPGGSAETLADQGRAADGPPREQNYRRLLEDLITEQSQAWMMNRFQPGSVRPGSPVRDAQGHAREIVATYSYLSMGKQYPGRVRLTFVNGGPQCLYFADLPESCRVPSPRIVSAYRKNQYADAPGANPGPRAQTAAPESVPTAAPEGAAAMAGNDAMSQARAAALAQRQAAAREQRCAAMRSNIDRARESLVNVAPQRAQSAEAQISRAELAYSQQCQR